MLVDAPPGSPIVTNRQKTADGLDGPAALAGDSWREPHLAVQRHQRGLDVREDRLDLDDEQAPRCRMEPEDIDGPALAVLAERHLGRGDPTVCAQSANYLLDDCCVSSVEPSIQFLAIPREAAADSSVESRSHPIECFDCGPRGAALLDPGDDASRDPGGSGQILLSPSAATTESDDPTTKAGCVNRRIFRSGPYPAITPAPRPRRWAGRGRSRCPTSHD